MLDTADEPVSTVNSSPKNMDKLKLLSRNYETSSSSDISSDSEPELIEKPVIQKPKDPAFLIPPDYILQSVKDLTADIKVSLLGKISQVFDKYGNLLFFAPVLKLTYLNNNVIPNIVFSNCRFFQYEFCKWHTTFDFGYVNIWLWFTEFI
ncbi:unnamed protein product [Schistosoma rodhaini]|nr:unnamed protein product [Schistosoma rodhaini]